METIILTLLGVSLSFLSYVLILWAVSPADPPAKWDSPRNDRHLV